MQARREGGRMATQPEGLDRLIEESSYVIKSTVTQLNASNEPGVRAGPGLIVAHVDEAFLASPSVGVSGLSGRDVTILLEGDEPAVGDKLLVFAKDWLYGVTSPCALSQDSPIEPIDISEAERSLLSRDAPTSPWKVL